MINNCEKIQDTGTTNKITIFLYQSSLFLLCFTYGLSSIYFFSESEVVHNLNIWAQLITYPILIYLIFKTKYSIKQFVIIILVGFIFFLEFYFNKSTSLIRYLILIIASKNIGFTKIRNALLLAFSSLFILSLILFFTGISDAGIGRRGAVSLGFVQPNITAMVIITIIMLIFVLKSQINGLDYIFLVGIAIFISAVLKTQTATILLLVFPLVYIFVKNGIQKKKKSNIFIMKFSQLISLLVSVLLVYVYPKSYYAPFREKVDSFFTYRPYLNYNNFTKYGFSFFGQQVNFYDNTHYAYNYLTNTISNQKYNTVDSTYIVQLISVGIVTIIPIYIFYVEMIKKAIKNRRYMIITISIICSIYGMFENNYNEAYYFFTFFYLMSIDDISTDIK